MSKPTVAFTEQQLRILVKNISTDPIATAAWLSQLAAQLKEASNASTDPR